MAPAESSAYRTIFKHKNNTHQLNVEASAQNT